MAYPVWFLSPAVPTASWLLGLPPKCLAGRPVITVSTCRNMWYRAQTTVRSLVEERGGRVIAHVTLEDASSTLASLVSTPRFFLTSKRRFGRGVLGRLLPEFGIRDKEYAGFEAWAGEASRLGFEDVPSDFRLSPGLLAAEIIGVRISRSFYLFWPLAVRLGRWAEAAYLIVVAALTVASIIVLMPLAMIFSRLPPFRRMLMNLRKNVVSASAPTSE